MERRVVACTDAVNEGGPSSSAGRADSAAGLAAALSDSAAREVPRTGVIQALPTRSYDLQFALQPLDELDNFALLASQEYNLGNPGNWHFTFRTGLTGFYARIHGVRSHLFQIHEWIPIPRPPVVVEYHLASIFFNMDSALECLVFALNALGWAFRPYHFHDLTDAKKLKLVGPLDVMGVSTPPRSPLAGHIQLFPGTVELWQKKRDLINRIIEQHDVSKHRQSILAGGRTRMDPPHEFFKNLGIEDDSDQRFIFSPMAEILLINSPKEAVSKRPSQALKDTILLEDLAGEFVSLINETVFSIHMDALGTIKLSELDFRSPTGSQEG
jgi:hypothetical protein